MSGFVNITGKVLTKLVVHTVDRAFINVVELSNESDVMFNTGIGITLGNEKPEKEVEEGSALLSFFSSC